MSQLAQELDFTDCRHVEAILELADLNLLDGHPSSGTEFAP
jgi:hypothetical protein